MSTPYYNADNGQPVVVQGYAVNTSGNANANIPTVTAYEPPPQHHHHHQQQNQQSDPPGDYGHNLPSQKPYYNTATSGNYGAPNNNGSIAVSDYQTEPPPKQFRDVLFAILFYLHLIVMAVLTAAYVPQMSNIVAAGYAADGERRLQIRLRFLEDNGWNYNYNNNDGEGGAEEINIDIASTMAVVVLSSASGLLLSTLALGFMITFAETLIKVGIVSSIALMLLTGLLSLAVGNVGGAVMGLMMAGLLIYYACRVWSRIPFAASNLATATTAVKANLGLAFFAYWSLFLTFGWAIWWTAGTISTMFVVSDCEADGTCDKDFSIGLMFLFFVSYYWTVQVISNVVHVTTAGTVAHWWVAPNDING